MPYTKGVKQDEENIYNHSSLSSCLSPGEGARAGSGDLEGVLERFCRTGDLDAERLLEREKDLQVRWNNAMKFPA